MYEFPALTSAQSASVQAEVERLEALRSQFRRNGIAADWNGPKLISHADLRAMANLQELFFDHHFTSHRPVIGPVIVAIKRLAVALLNRILKLSLVRQVELNQHTWNLALNVQLLEKRVVQLEAALRQAAGPDAGLRPAGEERGTRP